MKLISVKNWTLVVILRIKCPRIWVPPTQFQNLIKNFQNRIPRELVKNFYIPGIGIIHWTSFNFSKQKNLSQKKVSVISNSGIQPTDLWNIFWQPWTDTSFKLWRMCHQKTTFLTPTWIYSSKLIFEKSEKEGVL